MKRAISIRKLLVLALPFLLAIAMVAPAFAVVHPYSMNSTCQFNPGSGASPSKVKSCSAQLTKEGCQQYSFCFWRDTTAQNELADHTFGEFAGEVVHPFSAPDLDVWVYSSHDAANVVLVVNPLVHAYLLVGTGGSVSAATAAERAFSAVIPNFSSLVLRAIVYPDAYPSSFLETYTWTLGRMVPIYASSTFLSALQADSAVSPAADLRSFKMLGKTLEWGGDGFLGIGSGYEDNATNSEILTVPNQIVALTKDVEIFRPGTANITLTPTFPEVGGLSVFVSQYKVLIVGGPLGKHFPDVAHLNGQSLTLEQVETSIDGFISLHPEYLVFIRGSLPVIGASAALSALTAQRDCLAYVRMETIRRINLGDNIDDIAATLALPAALANHPYARVFTTTPATAARAVYAQYFGMFDGDPVNLNRLSTSEHAARLVAMAGGPNSALSYAKKCITEQTRSGVQMALEVSSALRLVAPSEAATTVYVQALKMLAWMESSAQMRNYYLMEAQAASSP